MLATLDALEATEYERFCTVLTAYAESDFDPGAEQTMQDGSSVTVGVFQQTSRFWPSALEGTAAQCRAFVADFRGKAAQHIGDPVRDCYLTQKWRAPDWRVDPAGFDRAPETLNFARRIPVVPGLIDGTVTIGA